MVVNTKIFKEACQTILYAIDNKDVSLFTETLELVTDGNILNLNVTNRSYFATVKFVLDKTEKFRAAVNAKTFLSLISKITTQTIDLSIDKNSLKIRANGEYTLPMIYTNEEMLVLPTIELGTVTNEMNIDSSILLSILAHNSKELLRGVGSKPVQDYYYVDEKGAITFTSGACVNVFTLAKPIKMLLSDKVVKLFKLFKADNNISFKMGQRAISDTEYQTIVKFISDKVTITAKLPDSGLITGVPVSNIRTMATKNFSYTLTLDKDELLQAINRIMIFNDDSKTYGRISVKDNLFTIKNYKGGSVESIDTTSEFKGEYNMILDLKNFKLILDGCDDEYITVSFGDGKAVVIKKKTVYDMLPELRE